MSKKQTVFLSAILGIGSIMMLSFLIISAIKADTTTCTVSNDLTVTGNTTLGDATTDSTTISGDLSAGGSLTVMGNTTLGDATTDSTTVSGDLSVGDDLSFNGEIEPDGSTCSDGQILKKTGADNWDCADDDTGTDTDTWITTQTCPAGQYLSSVGKTSKVCSEPGGDKYCYTYYSDSTTPPCTCPTGETNKKDLGTWGYCKDTVYGVEVFYPPGAGVPCSSICTAIKGSDCNRDPINVGLACVCCKN